MTAVDQVHPLLSDLIQSLSSINTLPSTYEGRNRMILWFVLSDLFFNNIRKLRLKRLNQMRASEELSSDDARQLSFDIETSLTEFHRCLASAR